MYELWILEEVVRNFLDVTIGRNPEWEESTAKDDRSQVTDSLGKYQSTYQGCLKPQAEKTEFLAVKGGVRAEEMTQW